MKFRYFFSVLLAGLLVWGGIYCYNRVTEGFSLHEMTSTLPYNPDFDIFLNKVPLEEFQKITNQTFHYIGKGCQFYVFQSEDGEHVIKFLKHKHLRPMLWLRQIPLTKRGDEWAEKKIQTRKQRMTQLFSSCILAYEELSEETGVIAVHLTRRPFLNIKMIIQDKLNLKHHIELDNYEFIIQKRAMKVKEIFSDLEKDKKKLEGKISQLADIVVHRCQKGIRDRDRSFTQNVAFSAADGEAVFIDIGQFYKDESITDPKEIEKDLKRRLGNLYHWTLQHCPAATELVEKEIKKRIP